MTEETNKRTRRAAPASAGRETETSAGMPAEDANLETLRAQLMDEVAEQAKQLSYMAEHDYLTGLPNRYLFDDRIAQAISFAQRSRHKIALLFLDLDHFKHINDTLGHAIGDQLLQAVAKRLQGFVRVSDTVSRLGGDEFVLLLTEFEHVLDVNAFADKLIHTLAEPYQVSGHQLHVTTSIGISLYPDDAASAEMLLRNADTAMYHAKACGRGNFQRFLSQMNARAVERQALETSLHQALEQQEFVLYYQPKMDIESDRITGVEALIRWQHPARGLVAPEDFIGIAEDSGLIVPIGAWALREACRQAKAWLDDGLKLRQIAVNVSAQEFRHRHFLRNLRQILTDTGLAPRQLELELTEGVLMHDVSSSGNVLQTLKEMGVRIAIDNFGTGYSSLNHLRRFPIDTLKIDRSFVQDIGSETGEEAAIVSAVIAMGKSLNQRLVAEGVETPAQLAFLQSYGCGEAQGYFFSRPMTADEFRQLLEAEQRPPDTDNQAESRPS